MDVLTEAKYTECMTAFAVEYEAEKSIESNEPIDVPDDPFEDPLLPERVEEVDMKEREMLEEIPLPGTPQSESDRKARWLKLPRNARVAIRKLHHEFGYKP